MCDDGDACTLADTCESGICKGSATPSAVLDGDSEVPFGGDPDGSGVIALKLNAASGTVCYEFSWSHIAEPTAARILGGDPAHPAAEQVLLFTRGASHSGCVSAAPQLIAKIRANPVGYYVQIENTEIPGGALRGKLARTKPCPATDDCHLTSFCNSAGGACVAREAVNGTPCDDGDRAKAGNTCREGVCKAPPQQTATLRSGQQSSSSVADLENSFLLPNKGDLYTLAVFAYCTNGNPYCNNFSPTSTLPGANTWFDAGPSPVLHGIVTNYYAQASFDQFMVYGDYWPNVVSIPCTGSAWVDAQTVTNAINNGPWATANNLPKALFDQWTPTSVGDPKTHAPNGKLDAVAVIWNNHRDFAYQPSNQPDACCSGCGYGLQQMGGGADATASFNEGPGGYGFFLAEFFHGLFGGNNFHNGGGAGQHTFLVTPHTHSACGQAFATSKVANAWDRLVMGWKLPSRSSPIMAGDSSCSFDVPSDIDITTLPGGGTFCLRDYNLTGDALRIKLPHLDWHQPKTGQNQDAKNQYLILENHRLEESLLPPRYTINADILGSPANPATPGYVACMDPSKPGLYPYIQVGKDIKVGSTSDLYFAPASQPNGLGSWTFPLDAAGNWDYVYRRDLLQAGSWQNCNWNNANVPKQSWAAETLPNPLTGLSDLGWIFDANNDGTLYQGDDVSLGLSEVQRDGTVRNNWTEHGDSGDSYRPGYRTRIALDTNPASTPVYTYTISPSPLTLQSYENRRIYLNGLSVQILNQKPTGASYGSLSGAMIVQVRWDDTQVNSNLRLTGDIDLQKDPDDPYLRPSTIDLSYCHTINLDQGRSPTQLQGIQSGTNWLFAQPTILTLEAGTATTVRDGAKIMVRHGSTLYVKSGANLIVQGGGAVIVDGGAFLCVESGAHIDLQGTASRFLVNTVATAGINPALGLSATCQPFSAVSTTGPGTLVPANGCVTPPSGIRAYWPFDGAAGIETELVHGNTLYTQGNPASCAGIVNNALCLDGLTTYARAMDNPFLNVGAGDFSIAGWIRTLDDQGVVVVLDKRVQNPAFRGYSLFLYNGQLGFQMADGAGTQFSNYISTAPVADGNWHHVAITVRRNSATGGTFYVDCCPVSPGFNPRIGNLSNASQLIFGRRSVSADGYLSAALDDFQIYNRALTPVEIGGLCAAVGVGMCTTPFCGNGVCESGEDCCSCPADCSGGVSCCRRGN